MPVKVDCASDFHPTGLVGDHGGKCETSLAMTLDEQLLALDKLRRREDFQFIGCGADALESSADQGADWLDQCARANAVEAHWLVDHHPDLPPRMVIGR